MKKPIAIVVAFLLVAALAVGAVILVKHRKQEVSRHPPPDRPLLVVESAQVRRGRLNVVRHYSGRLEAVGEVSLAPRIRGRILSVARIEGQRFSRGDVLVRIDGREIRREAEAMKAELKQAESRRWIRKQDYDRKKRLFREKAVAGHTLDQAEAAFRQADHTVDGLRRRLARIETRLGYTVVRAPFDGVVTDRTKEPGDMAAPSVPILRLERPASGYRVVVRVPAGLLASIGPGAAAKLTFGDSATAASVSRVLPAAGEQTGMAVLEIDLARRPFGLPTGAFVGVDLVVDRPQGYIVPAQAVLQKEASHLFVLSRADTIRPVSVRVVAASGREAVVDGPLNDGDRVAVANESILLRLAGGTKVQVRKEAP